MYISNYRTKREDIKKKRKGEGREEEEEEEGRRKKTRKRKKRAVVVVIFPACYNVVWHRKVSCHGVKCSSSPMGRLLAANSQESVPSPGSQSPAPSWVQMTKTQASCWLKLSETLTQTHPSTVFLSPDHRNVK